ncbi:MAG: hypothetical protein ACE14S_05960 [Candidatus Bathyarchaeia archaeon]
MANITISIPKELRERMKRHSEVKWSEVVRNALTNYVERLETAEGESISAKELATRLKRRGVDVSDIPLEKAIEHYEEGRKLERERLSSTQTSS